MPGPAVRLAPAALLLAGAAFSLISAQAGQSGPPAPVQQPGQRPVFRAGAHFVQVDVYPARDDRIVEGLTAADFEILEDGRPQEIASVEFLRVEPQTPDDERRDPNSWAEGNQLAADPRNRVFVLYLDHYANSLVGSYYTRRPIVDMLNRMLAPNDLFGVATVHTRPRDLVLGRRTQAIEDQLARHWTWGMQTGGSADLEPEERLVERCYGTDLALLVAGRTREERIFRTLDDLVRHLGGIREARKVFIVFTKGWPLARPDQAALDSLLTRRKASLPTVGVSQSGRLTTTPPDTPGMADFAACNAEIARAFMLDNARAFRELLDTANRHNVTFYPVNPEGLTGGNEDVLRALAYNTDGFTVMTNDIGGLLRRIADDVSTYYMLGYYSTNGALDGAYRRIEVRVNQPGVRVKARRGYYAPVAAPEGAGAAAASLPEGFDEALGALARLRPSADLFASGVAGADEIVVVVELAASVVTRAEWAQGADVEVAMAGGAGAGTTHRARIEAGWRSALVRVPRPAGDGPYPVAVRVVGRGDVLTDRLEVGDRPGALVGPPILFRATPSPRSPLWPVADFQFRRTERAHVEWPLLRAIDRREARLLAQDGTALAVPVVLGEREEGGARLLVADVTLAPLAAGDYVIELTAGAGAATERRLVAIRVRP